MAKRAIYIWRLQPILNAEGSVSRVVDKARRAQIDQIWIKIADGKSRYSNTRPETANKLTELIERANKKNIQIWGWHVPHCPDLNTVNQEIENIADILKQFPFNGLIMDAEGGGTFFQGDKTEASAYGKGMRDLADQKKLPLGISSNDIPQNIGDWLPKFNKIAFHATDNFPQVYYGGSPSVVSRLDRAVNANAHVTIPFSPVGAAWLGDGGGCASASACAERAREFILLCNQRQYPLYSFWHWGGAPLAFWEVLNTTAP